MIGSKGLNLILKALILSVLSLQITIHVMGGELSEFQSFVGFLRALDPQDILKIGQYASRENPCLDKWKGVECNFPASTIVEIRLENFNLSGVIDADLLCELPNLRVLNLARNRIRGSVPSSILRCQRMAYLNLSNNLLSGRIPIFLTKLKHLRKLDVSNNQFSGFFPSFNGEFKHPNRFSMRSRALEISTLMRDQEKEASANSESNISKKSWFSEWQHSIPVLVGICIFLFLAYFLGKKAANLAKKKEIGKTLPAKSIEDVKQEKRSSELVLFVEEDERFKQEDLHEATAHLRSLSLCSTLYKVMLNNKEYAVKRFTKLQVSLEEFGQIMRHIENMKHPNISPLVGYNYTPEEKLLIYKYQSNGSLLNLLEDYLEGKRDFQWGLRLSIAGGIARGLNFIYQNSEEHGIIPHGNLKLSNILLDENEEPLISEYGYSRFLDPEGTCSYSTKGYTPPERSLSEKGDVYSFGVILLELLTGKAIEKTGIDLPKWVNAIIREEWTGEVFDKELTKAATQWAFPLLNVALKCVSYFPENRPTMAEIFEKIEEVKCAQEDHALSPLSSHDSHQDCCLLHSIISETWETPGSNY
ncbi:hypothetical protein UlMin_004815 [Ulmus minor]